MRPGAAPVSGGGGAWTGGRSGAENDVEIHHVAPLLARSYADEATLTTAIWSSCTVFVGQVMRATKGAADPRVLQELVKAALDAE